MMTFPAARKQPHDIRAEISQTVDAAQAILNRAAAADRDLNTDETSQYDAHVARLDVLKGELNRAEAERERKLRMAEAQLAISTAPNSPFGEAGPSRKTMDTIRHKVPNLKAFKGPDAHRDAYLAGAWWKAVVSRSRGMVAEDAEQICASAGFDVRATMTEGNPGGGGYLVPTPLANAIIEVRQQVGVARRVCQIVPMTSDTFSQPKLLSGPTVTYPGEAGEFTASDEGWGQVNLVAKKRGILSKVSRELRDDALINVVDQLASRMGYEFALKEDAEFIVGDSTSAFGGETGVLAAIGTAGVVDAASGNNAWTNLDLDDFTNTMAKLPSKYSTGAVWICSMAFYTGAMLRALALAGGNTMVSLAQGVNEGLFLGKPVYFTDFMPTATAVSTIHALYGNFAEGVMLGDRQGVEVAVSDQRYFEQDVLGVRGVTRYDINVHEPGDASTPGAYVALKTNS